MLHSEWRCGAEHTGTLHRRRGLVCLRAEGEAQQVLNEIAFFTARQAERHAGVVVFDDLLQVREPTVVIKPALEMGKQLTDR